MQISLLICLIVLILLLIALERFSVIKILIRLILSISVIYFYVKSIADGKPIGVASLILVIILATINILIKNGIHKKSFSELISVLVVSLGTSGIVWLICRKVNLKSFQDEIMRFNGVRSSNGVMFGIYMIATLGIFMDIISRMIYHLDDERDKTVDISWKEQFKSGIKIGKEYIAEKINMVIFLILSVSLFPICMNINSDKSFFQICEDTEVFKYLLITIIASIGVVISVPVTACIYACLNRKKTIYKTVSTNKVDGKRSLKL